MKKLPGTIQFAVLPVVVVALAVGVHAFAENSGKQKGAPKIEPSPYVLSIPDSSPRELKVDDGGKKFGETLDKKSQTYCMKYQKKDDPTKDKHFKKKCTEDASTKSVTSGSEYTLICAGAHVTQQAGFLTREAMQAVEDLLK